MLVRSEEVCGIASEEKDKERLVQSTICYRQEGAAYSDVATCAQLSIRTSQSTLAQEASCRGVGLHSGENVRLTLKPAPAGTGLVFRRVDPQALAVDSNGIDIPVLWKHAVVAERRSLLVGRCGMCVSTAEHLLAALYVADVDNAILELEGSEIPSMDGSALPFVHLLARAGVQDLVVPRRFLRVLKRVEVRRNDARALLEPSARACLSVQCEICYKNPAIGRQSWSGEIGYKSFLHDLAPARTYGLQEEVASLRAKGLARGGSLERALLFTESGLQNSGGLRFEDECVRHKVIDVVGDMRLAGGPIFGRFSGVRAGHAMHLKLLRSLFSTKDAFVWETPERNDV